MFLSYKLPEGAPERLVWWAVCDVCGTARLGPFAPQPVNQREVVESAGWRYQSTHPMDTCTKCLEGTP